MRLCERGWAPYRLRLDSERHAWIAVVIDWQHAVIFSPLNHGFHDRGYFATVDGDKLPAFHPSGMPLASSRIAIYPGNPGPKPIFRALGSKDNSRLFAATGSY